MAISDMLEATKRSIECVKYEPTEGGKRCKHYLDNGACALPDELMCVEWLKANGHAVESRGLTAQAERLGQRGIELRINTPQTAANSGLSLSTRATGEESSALSTPHSSRKCSQLFPTSSSTPSTTSPPSRRRRDESLSQCSPVV